MCGMLILDERVGVANTSVVAEFFGEYFARRRDWLNSIAFVIS
jgi:hypothetical protein